ncbi:hypothetical protein O988_08769, partial [Pseudogymnoascus sp. VKM F-3808]
DKSRRRFSGHLGSPRPPHLNGSQLPFARPSALAMANEASNQRHKRCLADESADQSPTSWCQEVRTRNRPERDQRMSPKKVAEIVETLVEALNRRKRQRLNKVGSSRSSEWYKAMAKELNAKPSDPVATDKSDIEQKLRSGSSILFDYRFNLKDLTGIRAGDLTHHLQPNRFYHITCLEHIFSPQSLLEPNLSIFHWSKAYAAWEREDSKREWKHWEANYFSPERYPSMTRTTPLTFGLKET